LTLIASFQRPEGIVTISDVMLSIERAAGPSSQVEFPLRMPHLFQPFDASVSKDVVSSPVGMAQKAVMLEPNGLVLWAGSRIVAASLIKDLALASNQISPPSLEWVIEHSGVSKAEADQVSLITFLDRGNSIVQYVHNTQSIERPFGRIVHAGTGSYPGILDFDDQDRSAEIDAFHRGYLHRMMLMLAGELITQENAYFSFGGWFEFAQSGPGGLFSKTAYAIKLWLVDGDQIGDGPGLLSGYVGHDLLIFQLNRSVGAAPRPYLIADVLNRSARRGWEGEAPDREHDFEVHVVHFNDLKRTAYVVLTGQHRAITCEVRPDSLIWEVDPEFLKILVTEVREGTGPGHRLSRLSTWKTPSSQS
jgi:hypothetical protein